MIIGEQEENVKKFARSQWCVVEEKKKRKKEGNCKIPRNNEAQLKT